MPAPKKQDLSWLPPAIYIGGLLPGAMLLMRGLRGDLGPNPINEALNGCGELAVKCLLLCLACTPKRILFGVAWPIRIRKALGLLAFSYACAHLSIYLFLDQRFDLKRVVDDVVKRPFIAIGMITFTLLAPLAITSTKKMLQRLGAKRWQRLHKLVYLAAILAIIHYTMKQKESITTPLLHGAVLGFLFAVRIYDGVKRRIDRGARGNTPRRDRVSAKTESRSRELDRVSAKS
jgi:sulfoxide reductase heme-binding subunit YedZ